MKKIVLVNNDLSSYWVNRLLFMKNYFSTKSIEFEAIEIFGKGSPYDFDLNKKGTSWTYCLYPDQIPKNVLLSDIKVKLYGVLDKCNPDLVIAGPVVFTGGALALRWSKQRKKKIVIFDDAKHSFYKRNKIVKYLKKTLYRQADGILVPSIDYNSEYTSWNISCNRLFYGFNCVNNTFFANDTPFSEKNNWIVCVARLEPIKNLDRLILAWDQIKSINNNFTLIIAGEGGERTRLEEMVQNLKIPNVKFLGALQPLEISRLLSLSKGLILPSVSESWGLVINEAMASGLPILVSHNINAGHTLLVEGENGFAFDPIEIHNIAEVLKKYINLPEDKMRTMGENSLKKIQKFDYSYFGSELSRCLLLINGLPGVKTTLFERCFLKMWKGKRETKSWNSLT